MGYYVLPEQQFSATVPLGISTSANQVLQLAQETAINGKLPATLGQKTMAASMAVVLPSDQAAIPVTLPAGLATSALQTTGNNSLGSIDTKLTSQATAANQLLTNTKLDSIVTNSSSLAVVDMLDTPLLDVSSTNIPASAANSLQVVASTAAIIRKVLSIEDIGEFIGLYSGPVATPTLVCVMPLGGGEVNVSIPIGSLLSLRNMKNAAITSGNMAINFLG